jgi:tetratricopeptide (TPR) repeat protein
MRMRPTDSTSPPRERTATALGLLLGLALSIPQQARSADPFYEEQLRRGRRAYEIGKFEEATKSLRIAGFGLLEEPLALTESLLYLGLAQAAMNERAEWGETFERIVEIEDQFSSYSNLDRPEIKRAFEELVRRWVDPQTLELSPGFEKLAPAHSAPELDAQSAREALRERLRDVPGDVDTMLELARLERQLGRERKAIQLLDRIADLEPTNTGAQCTRLEISFELQRCNRALAAYPYCAEEATEMPVVAFLLDCLAGSGRWSEASALLAMLPEDRRSDPDLGAFDVEIRSRLLEEESRKPSENGDAEGTPIAEASKAGGLAGRDAETAAEIRRLLAEAAVSPDLEEPIRLALDLADRYPASREAHFLAAEALYRAGRWTDAVEQFRLGGEPTSEQPLLLFYFGVSLFESDETDEAATAVREAIPLLEQTPFVDSYVERILGQ